MKINNENEDTLKINLQKINCNRKRILKPNNPKIGGIFDEAMLLGAKGLILIIIIAGFAISVLSVISKFTGLLDAITQELPDY